MTTYTVRVRDTLRRVSNPSATLEDAINTLESERAAHLLNPPGDHCAIELVITADDLDDQPGNIVVRYAAGPQLRPDTASPDEQTS